jgi:hypothetical protein
MYRLRVWEYRRNNFQMVNLFLIRFVFRSFRREYTYNRKSYPNNGSAVVGTFVLLLTYSCIVVSSLLSLSLHVSVRLQTIIRCLQPHSYMFYACLAMLIYTFGVLCPLPVRRYHRRLDSITAQRTQDTKCIELLLRSADQVPWCRGFESHSRHACMLVFLLCMCCSV